MGYNNFKIGKDGLYTSSKTPQEGYTETRYGTNNEKITYKKNVDSIEGVITKFLHKDITFEGKTLKIVELTFKNGNDFNTLSCNQYRANGGNYSDEFTRIISAMRGYKIGEFAKLTAYHRTYKDKNGVDRKSLVVNINHTNILNEDGKPEWTGFIPFDEVPKPESKIVREETVWNYDAQMDFYWEEYKKIAKNVNESNSPSTSSEPTIQESKPSQKIEEPSGTVRQPVPTVEDDDDLPF